MQLERVAIVLRARTPWEAVDLGFRMAARWAGPLWLTWLASFVPVALVLCIALADMPWLAALLLWWLLPLFERLQLHVLARAVFGDVPTLAQTLGAWRQALGGGLAFDLLLRPFAWRRSFVRPVRQLERQHGAAAAARRRVLLARVGPHIAGLATVFALFVLAVGAGLEGMIALLTPGAGLGSGGEGGGGWQMRHTLLLAIAFSLLQPFHVAAGFALYLSRRIQLEGWDIELGLRRMARSERATAAPVLTATLLAALLMPLAPAQAAPNSACTVVRLIDAGVIDVDPDDGDEGEDELDDDRAAHDEHDEHDESRAAAARRDACRQAPTPLLGPARTAIDTILADTAFGGQRDVTRWRPRSRDREDDDASTTGWRSDLGAWFARGFQVFSWIVLTALVLALVWALARHIQRGGPRVPEERAPPVLFGLAISPDSLPDDVAAEARAALGRGELREALSLLYRGALSDLVHRRGLRIAQGATEGDVQRLVARALPAATADWFGRLLPAWSGIAYGGVRPPPVLINGLCSDYPALFVTREDDR